MHVNSVVLFMGQSIRGMRHPIIKAIASAADVSEFDSQMIGGTDALMMTMMRNRFRWSSLFAVTNYLNQFRCGRRIISINFRFRGKLLFEQFFHPRLRHLVCFYPLFNMYMI